MFWGFYVCVLLGFVLFYILRFSVGHFSVDKGPRGVLLERGLVLRQSGAPPPV